MVAAMYRLTGLALLLAACGSEEFTVKSFRQVCAGKPVARAAAHVADAPAPIVAFEKRVSDSHFRYGLQPFPSDWAGAPEQIQLVACAEMVEARVSEVCKYERGYELIRHDATYKLRVVEAKTARVLAEETVELHAPACVGIITTGQKKRYPETGARLRALAEPIARGR
jgi:hypothetical protein